MTTPSGEPYQYGDDTVAARLEVDIPADAIHNLSDLSKLTADIRANMEATAKYNQDYVSYLRELPTAIGEVNNAQGQLSASRSSIFGGDTPVPGDPFAGRNYGDGSGSMDSQPGSGRPVRQIDQDTLINLARSNPRQVANMAADRGMDDYFDDDQSHVLPRSAPGPGPRPGSGRAVQFSGGSGPPSSPRSPRASTGPGDDDGRAAGTTTGRQVTSEGTESQAERAAKRLLEELERGDDTRNIGQKARGFGEGFQNNSLLNYLNTEGSNRGGSDAIGFAGGLGRMAQQSGESFQARAAEAEEQSQNLLARAGEVAATNPQLAAQLTERAKGFSSQATRMGRLLPLAKGAGVVGAGVGAVAGVNAAIQKGGETIHGFQGTGVQMGGGIAEGIAFEAEVRTMAMNPFISTEQSRKIMQSALSTGYTGKEFDTMTEFMAENLKNMNMEVAESTKLLQQNVLKGGQDVGSLQAQLSQNVAMAGETNLTADQLNDQFGRITSSLIDSGAGGEAAGALTQNLMTVFKDSDILKDTGGDTLYRLLSNDTTLQSYFAANVGMDSSVPLSSSAAWATDNLDNAETIQGVIDSLGQRISTYVDLYNRGHAYQARSDMARDLQMTENEAQEILEMYISGEVFDRARDVDDEWEELGGGEMSTNFDLLPGPLQEVKGGLQNLRHGASYVRMGWNRLTGDHEQAEEVGAARRERSNRQRLDEALGGGLVPTYTPEILKQLALDEYEGDIHAVTIVDENDNERQLTEADLRNKETMTKLQGGSIRVKTEEGGIQTLREWGNTANTDDAGSGGMTHEVRMNEETRRFFNLESFPSQHQQEADRGETARNSTSDPGGFGIQSGAPR